MKNLKIGTKILVGYGIIISLIIIFAAVVIIANSNIAANVDEIHSSSQLQTATKDLMMSFYEARVNARTIYAKNDDSAYNNVINSINEAEGHIQKVNSYIAASSNTADFKSISDSAFALVSEWRSKVEKVQEANNSVDKVTQDARANQIALMEKSMGILEYQLELSTDEAYQAVDVFSRLRRIDRLEFGAHLAQNIEYIGSSFEVILRSYDLSRVPESKEVLDNTIADLQAFVDDSSLQYNIETGNYLLDALDAYYKDIDAFIETYNQRQALIDEAISSGEQALSALNDFLHDIDEFVDTLVSRTSRSTATSLLVVIAVSVLSIVFAIVFALFLSRAISRPIKNMQNVMDQVGLTGDMDFTPQVLEELQDEAKSDDEIGLSMRSFLVLIEHLKKTGKNLSQVAQGDLSSNIEVLSDRDTIGTAISNMMENLNHMFNDINASAYQVTTGSKQIADGSQALAQGSTQQAAAVQQLSSSISEIADKTKENAEMAGKAASLASTIKENAEKGSHQMDEMMSAVKEINHASQNISRVIKVIDDIAFQTNILALNAAVEAARAGQHGKGFAVVAEEVRSLAAKSAEAAKDTGDLIANSMEKAELGTRIADDTAASLADIVSGINESNHLVMEIAKSSEEQSAGITQINKGIDQVARVVQQNSATAEESAAASQQISGQASILEELVSRFKLKESKMSGYSLSGGRRTSQLKLPDNASRSMDDGFKNSKY